MAAKLPDPPATADAARAPRRRWFGRARPLPSQAQPARARSRFGFSRTYTGGDLALFGSGLVLSGFCAFFPWYVFFNQEQFGVRAVTLENIPSSGPAPRGARPATRIGEEIATEDNRETDLDTFTTGTTAPPQAEPEDPEVAEQPFPALVPQFELVHVANGRAMIQDDQGLYVVQRGSLLPDNSRVARIEKRDGRWVLVTTAERVLELSH